VFRSQIGQVVTKMARNACHFVRKASLRFFVVVTVQVRIGTRVGYQIRRLFARASRGDPAVQRELDQFREHSAAAGTKLPEFAPSFRYAVAGDHGSHGGRQISAPVEIRLPGSFQHRKAFRPTVHENTIVDAVHLVAGQVAARDFAGGKEENGVTETSPLENQAPREALLFQGGAHLSIQRVRRFVEQHFQSGVTLVAFVGAGNGDVGRFESSVRAMGAGEHGNVGANGRRRPRGLVDGGDVLAHRCAIFGKERPDRIDPSQIGPIVLRPPEGTVDGRSS
jgi:hypothetical protein